MLLHASEGENTIIGEKKKYNWRERSHQKEETTRGDLRHSLSNKDNSLCRRRKKKREKGLPLGEGKNALQGKKGLRE